MRLNLALILVAAIAVGCGSNVVGDTTGGGGSTGSGGSSGSSGTTGAADPRPTYPESDGVVAVGGVFPNVSVEGYLVTTAGTRVDDAAQWGTFDMQKIRNLVDANGKPYRYMLLDLSAGWCGPCNDEAESYGLNGANGSKIGDWLASGGLFVTVLVQNYNETSPAPADQSDVTRWLTAHKVQSTLATDADGSLSSAIDQKAFPANLIIDLDTMQIVDGWYADQPDRLSEYEGLLGE